MFPIAPNSEGRASSLRTPSMDMKAPPVAEIQRWSAYFFMAANLPVLWQKLSNDV